MLVLEFKGLEKPARALFEDMMAELQTMLDTDRLGLLQESLDGWISRPKVDQGDYSFNAFREIFTADRRITVHQTSISSPNMTEGAISFRVEIPNGGFYGYIPLEDFPYFARPLIQPWLDTMGQKTPVSPPVTSTPAKP